MPRKLEGLDPEDVVRGASRIAADVSKTLGPAGKALDVPGIGPSRDGVVVVGRTYRFVKAGEKIGAECMRALSKATFGAAGDGASRSVVIGNQILKRGLAQVKIHHLEPKEVARGIGRGIAAVTRELNQQKIVMSDPAAASRAAAITVGADAEIGELLGQALTRVGKHGRVEFTSGHATEILFHHDSAQITLVDADATRLVRASRAYAAAREMLESGAVLGGGLGLVRARGALDRLRGTEAEKAGFQILGDAIMEPAACIAKNAKIDFSEFLAQPHPDRGFDMSSGKLLHYASHGILDPVSTVTKSLAHAGGFGQSMVGSLEPGGDFIYILDEPDTLAPGPGGAAPPPRAPSEKVERFTDVLCPRQVSINTARFAVVVGLTIKSESKEAKKVEVEKGKPVSVVLTSLGVEPIGKRADVLTVQGDDDEPSVTFKYRPVDVGHGHIRVEYTQAGHSLASVLVPIEVVKQEVVEAPAHSMTPVRDVGTAEAAEWSLYVTYDSRPSTRSLRIELARGEGARKRFKDVALQEPPDAMIVPMYAKLEDLQAGGTDLIDQEVRGEIRGISEAQAEKELQTLGSKLWSLFLPEDFRRQYYDEREAWQGKSVIVYSNEPWIPWELMRPYQVDKNWESGAPWCETMRLTRWLQPDSQPEGIPGTPPLKLRMAELTLIVPKSSKLKSAKAERAFMLKFRRDHQLKDGGVEPVTDVAVRKALEQPYDWVHAAAHGVSLGKGTGEAPLLLDKGSIKPSDIYGLAIERPLLQAPSFVFNACQVGHEDWTVFGTSGWATQLVGRGAGMFIAPLWSVTDPLAHEFVIALYNELAAGKTVGEAVLAGRLKAREAGDPGDPTWLAYCVYAHPNARIELPPG
jgi:hypothetical protein